jgi:hypothetical protein
MSKVAKGRPSHNRGKPMSLEQRMKIMEKHIGGFWYGNVRYYGGNQYCERWTENLRDRVRAFFGYRCCLCGSVDNTRKLNVHHVLYNKDTCCDNSPRLLVALCPKCHGKTNFDKEYWSSYFKKLIDEEYGGRCFMSVDEYRELLKEKVQ